MVTCEVCKQELIQTGNKNIYTCTSYLQWIQEYNRYIDIQHYSCHLRDGIINYKKIIIYPYYFEIFYDDKISFISKSSVKSKLNNDLVGFSSKQDHVLKIESIIDFPWDNKNQVIQKLNLYSVFS